MMDAAHLKSHGINYDAAIDRFGGNAELYERLARKYAHDPHYKALEAALKRGDVDAAYQEAHALKGVAGNLSFTTLYDHTSSLVQFLRAGDLEAARALFPVVRIAHQNVISALVSMA